MRLYFLTRDIRQDYPRIGWLPPLPDGANDLWQSFGNLHTGDYPEILLSGHGGDWNLYLSAMDSGRADFISTPIRVSLYLSGHAGETDAVPALIRQYLRETILKSGDSPLLKNIFQARIKPGDPGNWTTQPTSEQETVAAGLLEDISGIPASPSRDAPQPPPRWMGGCAQKNIDMFLASCGNLLSGQAEGMALLLANLCGSDANSVLRQLQPNDHVAILLAAPDERDLPVRPLSPPRENPPAPTGSRNGKDASNRGNNGIKGSVASVNGVPRAVFWGLGGLLLAIAIIIAIATHSNQNQAENGNPPSESPQTTNGSPIHGGSSAANNKN